MNKKERVLAAFDCKPVDKVPVGFWFHFGGELAKGEACVKGHLDYYRETDIDFIKIMSDGFLPRPDFKIERASDWAKIRPLGKDSDYIRGQAERCARITEAVKDECLTFYNIFAPFSLIRFFTSDEMVMAHLKEDRAAVESALSAVSETQATLVEAIMDAGCEGGYFSVQGGEPERFSAEEYKEIVRPSDLVAMEAGFARGEHHFLHLCSYDGKNRMSVWDGYPGTIVNWGVYVDDLSLKDGAKLFKKTVLGGFDRREGAFFYNADEAAIKAETKRIIDDFGTTTGLMIGADCTIISPKYIPQIKWVVEATKEYAGL